MVNLKKLNIWGSCGIDQQGIEGLNLIELNANYNGKIKDVSFMINLKILDARDSCGIDQQGIRGLNLVEFDAKNNKKIKDISFMSCRN